MRHEGWGKAQDINKYYEQCNQRGETFMQMKKRLTHIETDMAAYGDWHLYMDTDGNYWEEFFSIGD